MFDKLLQKLILHHKEQNNNYPHSLFKICSYLEILVKE